MSDAEKFTLKQVVASSLLESKGLTDDLIAILENAITNNIRTEDLILSLIDGKS